MTLPGFSAEASLYRTSETYRAVSARANNRGMIAPAQSARAGRGSKIPNLYCEPGFWCVPDPAHPNCRICTFLYPDCNMVEWPVCDPIRTTCYPSTVCNPDPLNRFCERCTYTDEQCQEHHYQYCLGIEVPNKIPVNVTRPVITR